MSIGQWSSCNAVLVTCGLGSELCALVSVHHAHYMLLPQGAGIDRNIIAHMALQFHNILAILRVNSIILCDFIWYHPLWWLVFQSVTLFSAVDMAVNTIVLKNNIKQLIKM